jgi:D-inositol-3-phosphate glycosyltransferase
MITFVWLSAFPILSGTGGSENYTVGQVRELMRRGIPTQIVTIGLGRKDGRADFKDIKFFATTLESVSRMAGTVVFVSEEGIYHPTPTRSKSYAILHVPPRSAAVDAAQKGMGVIVPSSYARQIWAKKLQRDDISVVNPFACPEFGQVERHGSTQKILFAGRLTGEKGIYTLLEALTPFDAIDKVDVVATGLHRREGKILKNFLRYHPKINVIPAKHTAEDMAELFAGYDVVLMPSSNTRWVETFGMVSVEAQHAGCRVVASNAGGLPETDCGGLVLVEPNDPPALQEGILRALKLGPLTQDQRSEAITKFTLGKSVDALLKAINYQG